MLFLCHLVLVQHRELRVASCWSLVAGCWSLESESESEIGFITLRRGARWNGVDDVHVSCLWLDEAQRLSPATTATATRAVKICHKLIDLPRHEAEPKTLAAWPRCKLVSVSISFLKAFFPPVASFFCIFIHFFFRFASQKWAFLLLACQKLSEHGDKICKAKSKANQSPEMQLKRNENCATPTATRMQAQVFIFTFFFFFASILFLLRNCHTTISQLKCVRENCCRLTNKLHANSNSSSSSSSKSISSNCNCHCNINFNGSSNLYAMN